MSLLDWLTIAITCFIGAAAPGPSLLIILYLSSTKGLYPSIMTALGHGIGIFIYAIICAVGINFFILQFPNILSLIQMLGIIFLFYLGTMMLQYRGVENIKQKDIKFENFNFISIGIFTALINPKVILFFGAIFSQFMSLDLKTNEKLLISLLAAIIDSIWYILVAYISTFAISRFFVKHKTITINLMGMTLIILAVILSIKLLENRGVI